jgi:hypothetical protein
MHRPLAFLCALCAFVTVSSACANTPDYWIGFTLETQRGNSAELRASFRDHGTDKTNWSTGFMPSDLIGLEVSSFRASGTRPVRFALMREAGRLDCAGNGGASTATGNCRFTASPEFMQLLASRGIGRPTRKEAFGLMAVNARRELVDAIARAHYPTPSIDDLTALAALGVNGAYINDMVSSGYRPGTIRSLIEFKALNITAQWIAGFVRIGYANVSGDDLVRLRALDITPDYVAGFERIGYRNLPVDTLVQLKALDITPEFVRSTVGAQASLPPVDQLVQMKMFGRRH